jgi:hypothetical protein
MRSAAIWHYTSFTALASILQSRGLYLTRLAALRDPFEGILQETGLFRSLHNDRRGFVHCWTQASEESEVFWLAYAANPFGVAIESTTRRLQSAFSATGDPRPDFARIKYWNGKGTCDAAPWAQKRTWFRWEREFRVYVPWHTGAPDEGLCVKADLKTLISSVWVSPHAPQWLQRVVEQEMMSHGLSAVPVRRRQRYGPMPVTLKLESFIFDQLRCTAREKNLPLSDYIVQLMEDEVNPP